MKYSNIIYIALISFLFASCNVEDDPAEMLVDYSGTYEGILACTQGSEYEAYELLSIIITKQSEQDYMLNLGDDIILDATKTSEGLKVEAQKIGEGQDFDFFTIEGTLAKTESGFLFDLSTTEGDEEDRFCSFDITKL